jgi:hypothetical protein
MVPDSPHLILPAFSRCGFLSLLSYSVSPAVCAWLLFEDGRVRWASANAKIVKNDDGCCRFRIARAEALQWMFFERHSLESTIGATYFWLDCMRGAVISAARQARNACRYLWLHWRSKKTTPEMPGSFSIKSL